MILMTVVSNSAVSKPLAELSVPMPKFATQPSATLLFCKGVLNNTLQGFNNKKAPPNVTGIIENSAADRLRLSFNRSELMVATTTHQDGTQNSYFDWPYKIIGDDPVNFYAMRIRKTEVDDLQTIALDRVTGTLILTVISASYPNFPAHPHSSSTFYVCSPTDD